MTRDRQFDTLRRQHVGREQLRYMRQAEALGLNVPKVDNPGFIRTVKAVLETVRPSVADAEKLRIGGGKDGGYVMLDPGEGGVAYSFGVSPESPWDLAMARRGFSVFQYDGSIEEEPDLQPGIFFHKTFVGNTPGDGWTSLDEILETHGHEDCRDIILQIDIEGGEWDFFAAISPENMRRFKQIIVEFHYAHADGARLGVLRKIRNTHTPVHFHCNNYAEALFLVPDNFLYCPNLFEVTYARTEDYAFQPDTGYYPTEHDRPNVSEKPEIPLGYFDLILGAPKL